MNPLNWLLSQCGRPRGFWGRRLVYGMNREHARMTDWALSLIALEGVRSLLDVGCGGGAALLKLSKLAPGAELHGIDYSAISMEIARRKLSLIHI